MGLVALDPWKSRLARLVRLAHRIGGLDAPPDGVDVTPSRWAGDDGVAPRFVVRRDLGPGSCRLGGVREWAGRCRNYSHGYRLRLPHP
ncbi:MAG TPA: hypothetical protein VI248_20790, partial [Kineosporiaceae bacterium]